MDTRLAAYIAALPARGGGEPAGPPAGGAPDVPFNKQLRAAGLIWRCGALMGAHLFETGLLLASWAAIGYGALNGRLDNGWLAAWALFLASMVPVRMVSRWAEGVIAVGFGGLLKQRLIDGALRIDADLMRRKGAGELLGEVLETETIERLGTGGGLETLKGTLELLLVPFLLAWGAGAGLEIVLLVAWSIMSLLFIAANTRCRFAWTRLRLGLTHQLVEKMSAHRTRLAQQAPAEWHREEDREMQEYAKVSENLDRSTAAIEAALPRGYVITALAGMAPSFLAGNGTLAQHAITLGAVLFAAAALERLTFGLARGAAAWIAWSTMQPLFEAASKPVHQGVAAGIPPDSHKLLQARDAVYTYAGRVEPVVKGCSLTIERGDFLLLEGGSGSGKSTITALLAGLRQPSSGVILAGGLDRQTLGEEVWRRRIAAAPQYHENHILSASLAFNLLLGRPYPHSPHDIEDARQLCQELGLGPLIERMPAGLEQIIGETGWQLSQGERSRVFLARALLQDADLVILDESLAALDPENLEQCLECVLRRARTLLLIAHP